MDNIISPNSNIPCTSLKMLGLTWDNNEGVLGIELGALLTSINSICTMWLNVRCICTCTCNAFKTATKIWSICIFRTLCNMNKMFFCNNYGNAWIAWDELFSGKLGKTRKGGYIKLKKLKSWKFLDTYFDVKNLEKGNI